MPACTWGGDTAVGLSHASRSLEPGGLSKRHTKAGGKGKTAFTRMWW